MKPSASQPQASAAAAIDLRSLSEQFLREQGELTAVEQFSHWHDDPGPLHPRARYRELLPVSPPGEGQQYAFQVDLDRCSGCKSCVTACHSLNGLDADETWRSVGVLHGGTAEDPFQQYVTTACHHCLEPACMQGCPAMAYEKDPETGLVILLDDQCIGCQYCTLTCPYDVPKYNSERGIVRKCDMCSDRLAQGEAPACVQACPTQAISIALVDVEKVIQDCEANTFMPGAAPPEFTLPTTSYHTRKPLPRNLLPADYYDAKRGQAHPELVVMLVLTQLSVGAFCVDAGLSRLLEPGLRAGLGLGHSIVALAVGVLALAASTLHLGRPLQAWRAVLGLRTSWLSREILMFGLFSSAAAAYAASYWLPGMGPGLGILLPAGIHLPLSALPALTGLLAVGCSVMVYHKTRRKLWQSARVARTFLSTTALLGTATILLTSMLAHLWLDSSARLPQLRTLGIQLASLLIAVSAFKLVSEVAIFRHLRARTNHSFKRAAILMSGELRMTVLQRFALGIFGGLLLPAVFILVARDAGDSAVPLIVAASLIFAATLAAETLERFLFFAVVDTPKMPGGI